MTLIGKGRYAKQLLRDVPKLYREFLLARCDDETDIVIGNLTILVQPFKGWKIIGLDEVELGELLKSEEITVWDHDIYKQWLKRLQENSEKAHSKYQVIVEERPVDYRPLSTNSLKTILDIPKIAHTKRSSITELIQTREKQIEREKQDGQAKPARKPEPSRKPRPIAKGKIVTLGGEKIDLGKLTTEELNELTADKKIPSRTKWGINQEIARREIEENKPLTVQTRIVGIRPVRGIHKPWSDNIKRVITIDGKRVNITQLTLDALENIDREKLRLSAVTILLNEIDRRLEMENAPVEYI